MRAGDDSEADNLFQSRLKAIAEKVALKGWSPQPATISQLQNAGILLFSANSSLMWPGKTR